MKKKLMIIVMAFGFIFGTSSGVMAEEKSGDAEVTIFSQTDSGGRPPM